MWTPDALASNARPYAGDLWRMVETQARCATNRLVDTLDEQVILERLVDETKPPVPDDCAHLDFLLFTPFRYAPYPHASRFRRAGQPEGAFYASEGTATLIAENTFHVLLFFAESPGTKLPSRSLERTAFRVPCRTHAAIDLTKPPLRRDAALWTQYADYGPCHDLADAARAADVAAIRYRSVRNPAGGCNVALLACAAFAAPGPTALQTWHVAVKPAAIQLWCESPRADYELPVTTFAADPRIAPLVEEKT